METKKQSKATTILVIALILITVAALMLATFAWARYTYTSNDQTTQAVVAKWNVGGNSSNLTWSKTFTHVVSERLAPGTSGTIPVNFGINDTEVDVHYTVTLVSVENKPQNLTFYTDSSKKTTIDPTGGIAYEDTIPVGGSALNAAIFWDWPYRTGTTDNDATVTQADLQDTADGENHNNMIVTLRIDAYQVKPEAAQP